MKQILTLFLCLVCTLYCSTSYGQKLQAPQCKSVIFSSLDSDTPIGKAYQQSGKNWVLEISGETSSLTETSRDQWTIYGKDSDGTAIALNLHRNIIQVGGQDTYKVLSVSAEAEGGAANVKKSKKLEAKNVTSVSIEESNGKFVQTGDKSWTGTVGNTSYQLTETRRGKWGIFLIDNSTKVPIMIDLWKKHVLVDGKEMYKVSGSSDTPLGNNIGNTQVSNSNTNNNSNGNSTSTKVTVENVGNYAITVYKELSTGEREKLRRLAGKGSFDTSANIGDIFSFDVEKEGHEARNVKVVAENMKLCIKSGIPYGTDLAQTDLQKVENVSASRHGYDLKTIDPLYIAISGNNNIPNTKTKGGMRAQIFNGLKKGDIDWDLDGEFLHKNQFEEVPAHYGSNKFTRDMYHSASGFKKAFSANIGLGREVSGELPGAGGVAEVNAKAKGSGSFEKSYEKNQSDKNIYAVNKVNKSLYGIKLNPAFIDFTESFVKDVTSLSVPKKSPTSMSEAKSYPEFSKYEAFVRKYGTHYPENTTYGGRMMSIQKYSYSDMEELTSMGVKIAAEVEAGGKLKGIGAKQTGNVGVGYQQSEQYKNIEEKSVKMQQYVGGATETSDPKNFNTWNVTYRDAMPIAINLARISRLIKREHFPLSPDVDFEAIQKMLHYAISDRVGNEKDDGTSQKPRVFSISKMEFHNIDGLDHTQIYGSLFEGINKNPSRTLWHVTDDEWGPDSDKFLHAGHKGKKQILKRKADYKTFPPMVWTIDADKVSETVRWLGGSLYRWHNLGRTDGQPEAGDRIGTTWEKLAFSNINGSKDYILRFDEHIGRCQVTITVEEQIFNFQDQL